jgi:hypothetical protein
MKITRKIIENIILEVIEDVMDEANYPTSFNMEEFKTLKSFSARLQYCKEHLQPIASGTGRYVFGIDANTVLKLAKNKKGVAQNEAEYDYANDSYISIIAKVFECDDDYLWLEMEKMNKCTLSKFKAITGFSFQDFCDSVNYYYNKYLRNGNKRYGNIRNGIPDNYDEVSDSELFGEMIDLISNFDISYKEFFRLSSWGITNDGRLKIVDAGLNDDIYDEFYKR